MARLADARRRRDRPDHRWGVQYPQRSGFVPPHRHGLEPGRCPQDGVAAVPLLFQFYVANGRIALLSASTSKSLSDHWPEGREVEARLRISGTTRNLGCMRSLDGCEGFANLPQTAVPRGTRSLSGLDDPPPGRILLWARNFSEWAEKAGVRGQMWLGIISSATMLFLAAPAFADACLFQPRRPFQLSSDTVEWTMLIASGRTCTQGLRLGSINITSVKLIAPPQSGKLDIKGPSFSYAAKADFQGQDEFTIQVSGTVIRIAGVSDVKVTVFVVDK
jgi:hypothetical protein